MRIQLVSDLHFEIERLGRQASGPSDLDHLPAVDCDVLVLAGDIDAGLGGVHWALRQAGRLGKPVVYVFGNHEYYGHTFPDLLAEARDLTRDTPVHVLERSACVVGGVRFLGCTLWTDFGVEPTGEIPLEVLALVADFRHIRVAPDHRRFTPGEAAAVHHASREWLRGALEAGCDGPTVVVTHHAPSPRSLQGAERESGMEAAYANDLHSLMSEQVPLWVHGHVHRKVDYRIGATRVVCNPRGYNPFGLAEGFSPGFVLDLAV